MGYPRGAAWEGQPLFGPPGAGGLSDSSFRAERSGRARGESAALDVACGVAIVGSGRWARECQAVGLGIWLSAV